MIAETIKVSDDMIALVGAVEPLPADLPADAVALCLSLGQTPALRLRTSAQEAEGEIALIVARRACVATFGREVGDEDYHLPSELRAIALAICESALEGPARLVYRGAKAIELLCESFRLLAAGALVPMQENGIVPLADARRLLEARRLIDERWHEKLTIDGIARACGLNRLKLTQGFRAMFHSTVATAIAERRLDAASQLLRTTDRPISTVGYESGYLNNASFARAFARRFGVSPSDYRAARLAA